MARELTKRFEEVRRADLATLAAITPPPVRPRARLWWSSAAPTRRRARVTAEEVDAKLTAKLATASLRDAVRAVTAESGWTRADVYARALALRGGDG